MQDTGHPQRVIAMLKHECDGQVSVAQLVKEQPQPILVHPPVGQGKQGGCAGYLRRSLEYLA